MFDGVKNSFLESDEWLEKLSMSKSKDYDNVDAKRVIDFSGVPHRLFGEKKFVDGLVKIYGKRVVGFIPSSYQTSEMWNSYILDEFYGDAGLIRNSHIEDSYIQAKEFNRRLDIPEKFSNNDIWKRYIRKYKIVGYELELSNNSYLGSGNLYGVPEKFQNQELWDYALSLAPNYLTGLGVPEKFSHSETALYAKKLAESVKAESAIKDMVNELLDEKNNNSSYENSGRKL